MGEGPGGEGARRLIGLLALTVAASLLLTCSRAPRTPEARSVLLITVDTLRADVLGFAGHPRAVTPHLDRLAAAGRVFTHAHAHSVTTLPSHASLLTGLYPEAHGVRQNGAYVLGEGIPTLAEHLRDAGFRTAAFIGAFPLDSRFGLDRGFEIYDDSYGGQGNNATYNERRGDEVVSRALAWWQAHTAERRFLWVHLFDPHAPYQAPEPYASRFAAEPYLGEVAAVDAFLGPLLEQPGPEDLVIFTSDHGESLGEHGEATHGLFAYEATLRVPLVLAGPGVDMGNDPRDARLIDVAPTILQAAHLPVPKGLPGHSLLAEARPAPSYFEALSGYLDYGWAPLRGVVEDGKKYIELPIPEYYDLRQDAAEADNLFPDQRRAANGLAAAHLREDPWPPEAGRVPDEAAARLRSLGYLSGGGTGQRTFTPEDDPKRLVELNRKVLRMVDLGSAGRRQEAIALGREVLAARPAMPVVALHLATYLTEAGQAGEAVEVLLAAQRAGASSTPTLLRQLGLSLLGDGQTEKAVEVLAPMAETGDPEAQAHVALALASLGRREQATAALERATALYHEDVPVTFHDSLAVAALTLGRYREAASHAKSATLLAPERPGAWNNLGIALHGQGQVDRALDAWRRGLELAPDDPDILYNLGLVLAERGEREGARRMLEHFLKAAPEDDRARRVRQLLDDL